MKIQFITILLVTLANLLFSKRVQKRETTKMKYRPGCEGFMGFKGFCLGPNKAKKSIVDGITNQLKIPTDPIPQNVADILNQQIENLISPLVAKVTDKLPAGCLGNFKGKTLVTDEDSKLTTCGEFPLYEDGDFSAAGLHVPNVPCTKPVNLGLCVVADKCGSLGFSITGDVVSCGIALTGYGAMASPFMDAMKYFQFGYSPVRKWQQGIDLFVKNRDGKLEKKTLPLRSHIYMGADFGVPKLGMQYNGQDIAEMLNLSVQGKAFIDFGSKNEFTIPNLIKTFESKKSFAHKAKKLIMDAREYSFKGTTQFDMKLSNITDGSLPDIDGAQVEINALVNLGPGPDGDRGSSGTRAGYHLLITPNSSDKIMETFLGTMLKVYQNMNKIAGLVGIKLPTIGDLANPDIGFFIGTKEISFNVDHKLLNFQCIVRYSPIDLECDIGGSVLSLVKQAAEWVIKHGKILYDKAAKEMHRWVGKTGDAINDVGEEFVAVGGSVADRVVHDFNNFADNAKDDWNKMASSDSVGDVFVNGAEITAKNTEKFVNHSVNTVKDIFNPSSWSFWRKEAERRRRRRRF